MKSLNDLRDSNRGIPCTTGLPLPGAENRSATRTDPLSPHRLLAALPRWESCRRIKEMRKPFTKRLLGTIRRECLDWLIPHFCGSQRQLPRWWLRRIAGCVLVRVAGLPGLSDSRRHGGPRRTLRRRPAAIRAATLDFCRTGFEMRGVFFARALIGLENLGFLVSGNRGRGGFGTSRSRS